MARDSEPAADGRINVLVTGGALRIGRAIVEGLSRRGYAVAIHHNSSGDEARSLAENITASGGRAVPVGADLTDREGAERLIAEAEAQLGPIDLLINSASIFVDDDVRDIDWAVWDTHFALHLMSPVALSGALARRLPEGRDGLIVNVIDQRVWKPTPRHLSYTLSKSALWTATRTLAQALAPRIRVNAIGPGPSMPNSRQKADDFQRQVDGLLLRRGPSLSEFAETIDYLWHARSVTGQMIALDGGQHLAWETPDVTNVGE